MKLKNIDSSVWWGVALMWAVPVAIALALGVRL